MTYKSCSKSEALSLQVLAWESGIHYSYLFLFPDKIPAASSQQPAERRVIGFHSIPRTRNAMVGVLETVTGAGAGVVHV